LPLISKGAKIRIWFDGWPTIVFSGWPDMSYGTFGGRIVAVEKFISDNGKFRVLLTLMKILAKTIKYWIWSTNNCIAKHRTCLV
jgi:hypothetical protein